MKLAFDPTSYETPKEAKKANYETGLKLLSEFVEKNPQLKLPEIRISEVIPNYGIFSYRREYIGINYKKCRPCTKTPGFSWSFSGYKADLTHIGVLAHEMGHAIQHQLGIFDKEIKQAFKGEAKVTSYEPNPSEAFAEAIKLFITDPHLLLLGRPKRYHFLAEEVPLQPIQELTWEETLKFAHPKFHNAAKNWIKR